jgi:hypothetical protein
MLSTMSRCADYFRNFQNGRLATEMANMLKIVSMATAAKFVQPIPIFFLAYLVSLDVDVVPVKFH